MFLLRFFSWFCFRFATALGWKYIGGVPKDLSKAVIIVAPHTSNWDFIIAMGAYYTYKMNMNYLGKDSIKNVPLLKTILYESGYIPVDRNSSHDVVQQMVQQFEKRDHLILAIAPEGTRSSVNRWRSGFYSIALAAKVPIIFASFDFKEKITEIGRVYYPTGDPQVDYAVFRSHYEGKHAKHPELFDPAAIRPKD